MSSGIYKIESKIKPEKFYIGSSLNIPSRWTHHLGDLKRGKHKNPKLQAHYNKYGVEDLMFSVLLGCDKDGILANEQFFIDSLNPWFNVNKTTDAIMTGRHHSDESKKKMSISKKGKPSPLKGRRGWKQSQETKNKRSKSLKGRPSPFRGHHHTELTKAKTSKRSKGNKYRLGQKASEETKKKMSLSHRVRKSSETEGLKKRRECQVA